MTMLLGRQCVYCLQPKIVGQFSPDSGFSGEHVIHKAFTPGFSSNLIVHDRVCAKCNSYFDNALDVKFTRNTMAALRRYQTGVKSLSKISEFKGKNVITYGANESSIYDGAPMKPCNREGRLSFEFVPHIAHEYEGRINRVFIEDLDDTTKKLPNLTLGTITLIESNDDDKNRLLSAIERRGGSVNSTGKTITAGDIKIYAGEQMNEIEQRSIAKIAFNYFALVSSDVDSQKIFESTFNEIRDFVRQGIIPSEGYLQLMQVDMRSETGDDHLVRLRQVQSGGSKSLYCDVTLFGLYRIAIRLAKDCDADNTNIGHRWHFSDKKCLPIG